MALKHGLTAQVVIRDEPLAWYAIKSVVDVCSAVMVWDTGTKDQRLIEDCRDLAKEYPKKIDFRQVSIQTDERFWSDASWAKAQQTNAGKRGVGTIRLEQMQQTDTTHFMIVDGDEVHYRGTAQAMARCAMTAWPAGKLCGFIPMRWYCSDKQWYRFTPHWGRLFTTEGLSMVVDSPGEFHCNKKTGNTLHEHMPECFSPHVPHPCAHFETWIKPWRRVVPEAAKKPAPPLPEVMVERPRVLLRYLRDRAEGRYPLVQKEG